MNDRESKLFPPACETRMRSVDLYERSWRHGLIEHTVRLEREPALSLFTALTLLAEVQDVGLEKSAWKSWEPDAAEEASA